MSEKIPVIALVGPTASGKTELGVALAKEYNCEIISADSMQIYKGMAIATAKPSKEEMQGIPHHMMDFLELDKSFSVSDYVRIAKPIIKDIYDRGKLPLIVGGTGLYVDSLLKNVSFSETVSNSELRKKLYDEAEKYGAEYLHNKLKELDSEAAENTHMNNIVRVVRAIEICLTTGMTFTENKKRSMLEPSPYKVAWIGLGFEDRNILYDRINKRVDKMLEAGLLDEVKSVICDNKLLTAGNAIGLKEWLQYFNGTASLEECTEKMKLSTRHYAKRQLTWFRKNDKINWLIVDKCDSNGKKLENCKKIVEKTLQL